MNFLAHLALAGGDEGLRLGALLGDFVRGRMALAAFAPGVQRGIRLHRHIDSYGDAMPAIGRLRAWFAPPFRRYAGIVIDLAFDHELARRWPRYSTLPLRAFDTEVRELLAANRAIVPDGLHRFMTYADRRGLFAAYADPAEVLHSLRGIGQRLSRPNPLHRAGEIWADFEPLASAAFEPVFGAIQSEVADWLKSKSTITGS